MRRITCPECGEPIGADAVDFGLGVATCRACDAAFDLGPPTDDGGASSRRPTASVPVPRGVKITDLGDRLIVAWRWFTLSTLGLVGFTVVWDGFLVFWYFKAFEEGAPLIAKLFPLLHLAIGVGMTYYSIASLLNKTTIELTVHELAVRHGPVPWRGRKLEPARIDQLYCTERVRRNDNSASREYELHAALIDGDKTKLLGKLDEAEHALALEEKLEAWLGLEDRHVPGELKRG